MQNFSSTTVWTDSELQARDAAIGNELDSFRWGAISERAARLLDERVAIRGELNRRHEERERAEVTAKVRAALLEQNPLIVITRNPD